MVEVSQATLARRQTDPEDREFIKRGGDRKSEGIKVSNSDFDKKTVKLRSNAPAARRTPTPWWMDARPPSGQWPGWPGISLFSRNAALPASPYPQPGRMSIA